MANEKRLIDVNKVINSMQKCLDEEPDKKDSVAYFAFESIIECLKQEPTVDAVEVVHGQWIIGTGENALMRGCRMCSACGEIIKTQYSLYGMFNYCPNCGAKMDGQVEIEHGE